MAITQKNREIAIKTPLGEDVLLLTSMSGIEQLSRPFEFQLELASEKQQIKSSDLVGQNVTMRLNLPKNKVRYFNGFISSFSQIAGTLQLDQYSATVVPWLWFLTRTADCRIFQEKTVPDIIKQVFSDHGFTDLEDALTGSYRTWEYCVQYRETDFNFVSRLMEQEGIYYFFKHENGKHHLVLADSASAHESYPDHDQIKFRPADLRVGDEKYIMDWIVETRVQPGFYALNDFDFKNTKKDLQARAKVSREHAAADFEIYDYPGEYTESKDGEEYAKKRIEELHAQYEVVTAQSDVRGICTGCTFTLTEHPRDDQNRKYLITSANYSAHSDILQTGGGGGIEAAYSCSFTAIDAKQQFRSLRITPKPSIPGPQTAIVVGPSGEEIYPDKYGRVKVKFHWDRYSKADENSSCWIRVAQVWAGKKWGAMYIPRIGQEVIVEFLEGDPDQPIITGRIYNGQAMPPYDLPAEKTKSTIKSDSSKGGGGFNEIRFEDKKDSEQIFVHAQKDRDIVVENNETHSVGNDRQKTIDRDETTNVKRDRTETVDRNESITIGENRTESVGKNEDITIGQDRTENVAKNESISIGENRTQAIGKTEKVSVGDDRNVSIGKNNTLNVGKKLQISAGDQIVLKTGSATIVMKKNGDITIKGKKISVTGSGDIKIKGSKIAEN
ncbi:MAG: type VI secretion system tip protein VgrG [Phycisphaerae bacterium]|nr:type VI secretion system tip protein VgrG [Phycisphaerae bacterium]